MSSDRNSHRDVYDRVFSTSEDEISVQSEEMRSPPPIQELVDQMEQLKSPSRPGKQHKLVSQAASFSSVSVSASASASASASTSALSQSYRRFKNRIQNLSGRRGRVVSPSSAGLNLSREHSKPTHSESRWRTTPFSTPYLHSQITSQKLKSDRTLSEPSKFDKFSKATPSPIEFPVSILSTPARQDPDYLLFKSPLPGFKKSKVRSDGRISKKTNGSKKVTLRRKSYSSSTLASNSSAKVRNPKLRPRSRQESKLKLPKHYDQQNQLTNVQPVLPTTTESNPKINRKRKGSAINPKSHYGKIKFQFTKKSPPEKSLPRRSATPDHAGETTGIISKIIESLSDSGHIELPSTTLSLPFKAPPPESSVVLPLPSYNYDSEDSADC